MVAADRDNHPQATANEVDPPCGFLRTCLAVGAHLRSIFDSSQGVRCERGGWGGYGGYSQIMLSLLCSGSFWPRSGQPRHIVHNVKIRHMWLVALGRLLIATVSATPLFEQEPDGGGKEFAEDVAALPELGSSPVRDRPATQLRRRRLKLCTNGRSICWTPGNSTSLGQSSSATPSRWTARTKSLRNRGRYGSPCVF